MSHLDLSAISMLSRDTDAGVLQESKLFVDQRRNIIISENFL